MAAIEILQLSKQYHGSSKRAVNDISISIDASTIFGLLGPNGCGKTTTISMMCTLLKPSHGDILISGCSVKTQPAEVRKRIGLTPQNIALYPHLTLKENFNYFGRLYGLKGKKLHERIQYSLNVSGLDSHKNGIVHTFSLGMKRRANFAAALLHSPEILILDEVTAGVDPQSRNLIYESLENFRHEGTTIFLTTHYMEEAERLCQKTAIMDEGRILVEGSPDALISGSNDCENLGDVFMKLTGKNLRDSV